MKKSIFIEIPEHDKPLTFVQELVVSALAACAFVFIVSVMFVL
jgi:hypothetical protein